MTIPLVSVVLPTYNGTQYVLESIQSVLRGEFLDLELIVIDDGSTDRTSDLVRTIGDHRIKLIVQENRGIGAARNRGMKAARGRYIAFIDHDDVWLPDYLTKQIAFLEKNESLAASISQWVYCDDVKDLGIKTRLTGPCELIDPLEMLSRGQLIIMSSCLTLRASSIGDLQYSNERKVMEDVPFYISLLQNRRLGCSSVIPLMIYRRFSGNTSGDAGYFESGAQKLLDMIRLKEIHTRNGYKYAAFVCRQACMKLLEQRHLARSIHLYLRVFLIQVNVFRFRFLLMYPAVMLKKVLSLLWRNAK